MPLTLTATRGVLPIGREQETLVKLTDAMLRCHGLSGNAVMTPNVVGAVHVLDEAHTVAGGVAQPVVFVEWKVPSFAFASPQLRQQYVREATEIVQAASGGRQPRERIWVNVVHAVDGGWGIAGEALDNAQLQEALAAG